MFDGSAREGVDPLTSIAFTVFTKPWKLGLPELAEHVLALGFDGVEMAVRPGYPVTPENARRELPRAAALLATHGLSIASIASVPDENTAAACADAGVPIIRICAGFREHEGYREGEARLRHEFDLLYPTLERFGVSLGVQNHYGPHDVCNAAGLVRLLEEYDPRWIGAVWDAGHNGLEGEQPESALDIVWPHLRMVNLKSACWVRRESAERDGQAEWRAHWTTGREGRANWPRVAAELKRRKYRGAVCLTAEYTDEAAVDRLIAEDIEYARTLFGCPARSRE